MTIVELYQEKGEVSEQDVQKMSLMLTGNRKKRPTTTYNISPTADKKAFCDTCALIERKFKYIRDSRLLTDVDGTQIQLYDTLTGDIKVYNDYEVDAVYIESEIDLSEIL